MSKKIIEVLNTKDVGVTIYKSEDIKQIKDNVGNVGLMNEYQIHYTALTMGLKFEDDSITYFVFPLVYFNYEQKVSCASIDFEMKDVTKMIKEIEDLSLRMYAVLKDKLIKEYPRASFKLTLLNNIHKHP